MKARELTAREVTFTLSIEAEHVPIRGNAMSSGDEHADRECEEDIERQLREGNQAAWCAVVVKAKWNGFEAVDSLGCCSYESEAALRADLLEGMHANALAELNRMVQGMVEKLAGVTS